MKIIEVKNLEFDDVKIIRFLRFKDERGFFSEKYRESVFLNDEKLSDIFNGLRFVQFNESFSKKGVIRGLHFQWEPPQGKLLHLIYGKMIDFYMDIRKNSPTFGKIGAYLLEDNVESEFSEWLWIPPGFAHGNLFLEESRLEYLCTAEYNPKCESGICPLSEDIDWTLCRSDLKEIFSFYKTSQNYIISEKDKNAQSLTEWSKNPNSEKFN